MNYTRYHPSINCFPVTSTNVEISPKQYLTFSFNPFATMVQNLKAILSVNSTLLNLN